MEIQDIADAESLVEAKPVAKKTADKKEKKEVNKKAAQMKKVVKKVEVKKAAVKKSVNKAHSKKEETDKKAHLKARRLHFDNHKTGFPKKRKDRNLKMEEMMSWQ